MKEYHVRLVVILIGIGIAFLGEQTMACGLLLGYEVGARL